MVLPDRPLIPVTRKWIDEVLEAMEAKGVRRIDLARQLEVNKSTITLLLRQEIEHSRLVVPISDFLGIPYPNATVTDSELKDWVRLGQKLSREQRQHILALIQSLFDQED